MAIVTEISWDDALDGKPLPDSPARTAWRQAVAEVAEKAKVALPACAGRIDSAVKLVLAGDVQLLEGGKAKVASQSNGATQYVVCNGTCECRDVAKAPEGWCKHRLAAAVYRRATTRVKQILEETLEDHPGAVPEPAPVETPAVSLPLPEAPVSITLKAQGGGQEVMITLRGTTFADVAAQVTLATAWLQGQSNGQADTPLSLPRCHKHDVSLRRYGQGGQTWFSHRLPDGTWCKG
jgi:hypothetical protein